MADKKFDIIVYGATSFVGQIITRYMHTQFAYGSIVWAIAGAFAHEASTGQRYDRIIGDRNDRCGLCG